MCVSRRALLGEGEKGNEGKKRRGQARDRRERAHVCVYVARSWEGLLGFFFAVARGGRTRGRGDGGSASYSFFRLRVGQPIEL